jgi:Domain of unknown function (DUF4258)
MSDTLAAVQALVARGEVHASRHGFLELAADDILLDDVVATLAAAVVVEDYPMAGRGPSVLVLQHDRDDRPVHVVWGVAKGSTTPAVLITAYRPDPALWSDDFTRRKAP